MMVAKEGNLCDYALLCRFLPNFCPEFLKCPEYVRVASDLDSASPQNGAGKGRRFVKHSLLSSLFRILAASVFAGLSCTPGLIRN